MTIQASEKDTLSITLNDRLEVTLDFSGEAAKYKGQFVDYLKMYDPTDIGTLLNLKTWARSRNIPCVVRIHKVFSLWSWAARILVVLNEHLEKRGQGVVRPEKWKQ